MRKLLTNITVACACLGAVLGCAEEPARGDRTLAELEQALSSHQAAAIAVIDVNNAPVPCAQFRAWGGLTLSYVSDRNGIIALYEPGLMGKIVSFGVSHPSDPALFPKSGEKRDIDFIADVDFSEGRLNFVRAVSAVTAESSACTPGTEYTAVLDAAGAPPDPGELFAVDVTDTAGNPLPAVLLRSARQTYVTDNAGTAAVFDRALMNTRVSFDVSAHGYAPRRVDLDLVPGGSETVELTPVADQLARPVYRLTGHGLFHDSALLGRSLPLTHPLLDADVMSQDGPMAAVYRGKAFFTFGDTNHTRAGESNYRGSGGTAPLPGTAGAPDAFTGIDLAHFHTAGRDKAMAGPSFVDASGQNRSLAYWPFGLTTVRNASGQEELYSFMNGVPAGAVGGAVQASLGRWNDTTQEFEERWTIRDPDLQAMPELGGHSFKVKHGAAEYAYFENHTRIPATADGFTQRGTWEAYTPLAAGSTDQLVRDASGRLLYSWKQGTPQITAGRINPEAPVLQVTAPPEDERLFGQFRNLANGERVTEVAPTIEWNPYRQRYTSIFTQFWGSTSLLGEVWYAEADTPMGPWLYATKVATHSAMSFYNMVQLPFMSQRGGADIFFAGVFGNFLGSPTPVPRYNYNVLTFTLALDDARTAVPVPVYDLAGGSAGPSAQLGTRADVRAQMAAELPIPFLAYDRADSGALPARWIGAACRANRRLAIGALPARGPQFEPDFYVLPTSDSRANSVPLYEYSWSVFPPYRVYAVDGATLHSSFVRSAEPIARVIANPLAKVWFPVSSYLSEVVADAGIDQCVNESAPGQGADVTLDGRSSTPAGGAIASHVWTIDPGTTAVRTVTGATASVRLSAGSHVVLLRVTTADGRSAVDRLVVDVASTVELSGIAAEDGRVAECGDGNVGCTRNASDATGSALRVGDTALNDEVRSVLSFETASLPDDAVPVAVSVQLIASGNSGSPTSAITVDLSSGPFNGNAALENADFEALPAGTGASNVGTLGAVGNVHSAVLSAPTAVNRTGRTQLRLRRQTTSNNARADTTNFFSAESTAANRPKLRVSYYVP